MSESGAAVAALARADEEFAHCRGLVGQGFVFSLRRCLEKQHDGLLHELNGRYWKAIGSS